MSLRTICQNAIEEIGGFQTPSTIVGNADKDAKLLLACAKRVGREMERDYKWQALRREYTFNTADGVVGYDFPSSIRRFANVTFWSDDDNWPLIEVSNIGWRELNSGINVSGILYYFSVFGNKINLHPTPESVKKIDFDYYTKQYCETSGGTGLDEWSLDSDVFRLDEDVATLGVIYHFLRRKRMPYTEEKAMYIDAIRHALADQAPKKVIDVGRTPNRGLPPPNFPDGNWVV